MRVTTTLTMWAACLFATFAGAALAQQQEFRVGPFHAGISVPNAVAAIPGAGWVETHSTPSGRLIGARAENAVSFEGAMWDVSIGRPQEFGGDVPDEVDQNRGAYTNVYELRFERELPRNSARQCRADFASLVTTLESALGPFGTHPEFPDTRSPLYFNPYGPGMRVESIGQGSRFRIWPKDGMQPLYTFREPAPGFPYRTNIGLNIWDDNSCTLSFEIFQMPSPTNSAQAEERGYGDSSEGALPAATDRPRFEAPPAEIEMAASFSLANVQAARGNVARWRDSIRQRLGAYNEGPAGTRNMPGVSGYFATFGGDGVGAGIAHGRWFDADSGIDEPGRMSMLAFATPHALCNAQVYWTDALIAEATYLGPEWRPEFEALDAALRASVADRSNAQWLPEGVQTPYTTAPRVEDVTRVYPSGAMRRSQEGRAALACLVLEDYRLRCGVSDAGPAEFAGGFASAAMRVFQNERVRMAATASNGQATAGLCIRRGINFRMP